MTGGQFNKFFAGTYYERNGDYVAPTAPDTRFDVTYHGTYAAGINFSGPNTDLLPIVGPIDEDIDVPRQSAYVRGLIFVNVDLNDMSVEGQIYNRTGVLGLTKRLTTPSGSSGFQKLRLLKVSWLRTVHLLGKYRTRAS